MPAAKRFAFAFALALALCILAPRAHAQTPSIEVSTDSFEAQFAVGDHARQVRVEIFSPSGELVFEADGLDGQSIRWPMITPEGARVADGVYLATITVTDSAGKRRKRVEQINVSAAPQPAAVTSAGGGPEPMAFGAISGEGTDGRIAKFTGANAIGDSSLTENQYKIGVNTIGPTATLHVNGLQPAPLATNGATATLLLQTSGGKGGNTTAAGKSGGSGASISLVAGNGGNAPAGSFNGSGGNITLQPGSPGTGGMGGGAGTVFIAPMAGNVSIGTGVASVFKLDVRSTFTAIHAKHTGMIGAGGVFGESDRGFGVYGFSDDGEGVIGRSVRGYAILAEGKTKFLGNMEIVGNVGLGTNTPGVKLDVRGTTSGLTPLIRVQNSGSGHGVHSYSGSGTGVLGTSDTGRGVSGFSSSGYAGYFQGKARVTGLLEVSGGCNGCSPPSDRNQKANFSRVNPRAILNRLATIRIQTWNYKSEPETVRHIGAMAQDFHAAFNFGTDDKTLSVVDAHGVTMAAVQGLYQMMLEKDKKIEELTRRLHPQQIRLKRVERAVLRRRAARR